MQAASAFVDGPKIAQAQAAGRGEHDLAGYVAATIGHAQPFFWRASIARVIVKAVQTLPDYTFICGVISLPEGVCLVRGANSTGGR